MNNQAKLFKIENYFEPFDRDCVLRAKEVFDDYFEKGIILSYDFDHKKWKTTNEYDNISLFFNISDFQYRRFYQSIFQLPYKEFIDYLKSFIVFSMKQHVLRTLQQFLMDIKRIIKKDVYKRQPFGLAYALDHGYVKEGDTIFLMGTAAGMTVNMLALKL